MFSSNTDLWSTPKDFYDKLNKVFRFGLDVCALPENAKCQNYFTPDINGLDQEWNGVCWMNPPYGREISAWVEKAYRSAKKNGATVVCLLPARVDTRWWHDYCAKGEVTFIKGRLKFGGSANSAPFPNAIVVFRPNVNDAIFDAPNARAKGRGRTKLGETGQSITPRPLERRVGLLTRKSGRCSLLFALGF